jgi:hypothetical protein
MTAASDDHRMMRERRSMTFNLGEGE